MPHEGATRPAQFAASLQWDRGRWLWLLAILLGVMAGWVTTPWHPIPNTFVALAVDARTRKPRIGAGYGAFITARSDIGRYAPFPGVLPLGSIGYRNLDIQATFVPGGKHDGNVLFTWVKLSFY